ncbi:MAG: flavin reductase family protein [Firmicutes bacterium]|nr:flavin reductase family protein [Bacillota bacterium]
MALKKFDWMQLKPEIFSFFMDGMLLTAGTAEDCNTMAVGWGGLGSLWSRPVCTIYVRPTRHTLGFLEREDYFSLSVLPKDMDDLVNYCGTVSGRDEDKIAHCGFHIACGLGDTPYIAEAKLVLICKKILWDDIDPAKIIDPKDEAENYPLKDYHRVYVGEIVEAWQAE